MSRVHSTETVILVDGNNISTYCNDSTCKRSAGTEDNTGYGADDEVHDPTLRTGEFSCSGKYDSAAAGPRAVLQPLIGTKVPIKHRPEGTGSGLPQDAFDAVIVDYEETAPVAGYRMWALTTKPSGAWDIADQV